MAIEKKFICISMIGFTKIGIDSVDIDSVACKLPVDYGTNNNAIVDTVISTHNISN